jgi:hypothetical protein
MQSWTHNQLLQLQQFGFSPCAIPAAFKTLATARVDWWKVKTAWCTAAFLLRKWKFDKSFFGTVMEGEDTAAVQWKILTLDWIVSKLGTRDTSFERTKFAAKLLSSSMLLMTSKKDQKQLWTLIPALKTRFGARIMLVHRGFISSAKASNGRPHYVAFRD